MKRNRTIIEVFATLLLTALITDLAIPISAAANKPKSAGRTSNAAPNTILNGKGVPLSTQGIDGDFYIDTRSLLIYGPKKTGKWPLPQSLQGPAGIPGVDGKNGSEGKSISNASTVAGPAGAQGEKGEKGDKGEQGLPGGNGAPGPAGAKGETGATGPQGATGPSGGGGGTTGPAGPTGATGAKGDTGATGAAGAAGAQGPIGLTGPKGETGTAGSNGTNGAVGATGPSIVYTNNIPSWTLSTSTPKSYATSTFFLSYKSGKSYSYSIYLYGQSDATASVFAVEIIHSDGSTSRSGYSAVENINFSGEPKFARYTFTISGVISPVGGDVSLAIRVIDDGGITGGANSMTFSGIVFSTLVGAVGTL
ncbi:Collagen triple helix repeat [Candidatus Nanopelagicaceae bacterium]